MSTRPGTSLLVGAVLLTCPSDLAALQETSARAAITVAEDVSVTILSSNLANGGTIGEWGLSALVAVDGRCVLFDAGRHLGHRTD